MAKVIVERPRYGRGDTFPRARLRDWRALEEAPRRQSIRRPWDESGRRKCLNENLAPLWRYLGSNVGRPWNKVFSEMSQHVRLDSAVQLHVWQHVQWEVCFGATRIGREYVDSRAEPVRWQRFVVDARTGLLRKNPRYGQRIGGGGRDWRPPSPPSSYEHAIDLDELHQYWKIRGIWYLVTLAPLPACRAAVWDAVYRKPGNELSSGECVTRPGGRAFYHALKRQLNSKEIRRLPPEVRE